MSLLGARMTDLNPGNLIESGSGYRESLDPDPKFLKRYVPVVTGLYTKIPVLLNFNQIIKQTL